MTTFAYIAFDSKGKLFRGNVQEKSWTQALRRVKEMGLFPTSVKERPRRAFGDKLKPGRTRARSAADSSRHWPSFPSGIGSRLLTAFTRQMATLLEAGIPILKALRSIEEQEENRALRTMLREVGHELLEAVA